MRVFSKQVKHRKVFFISLLALTSLIIVSASNSEVLACSRSGNSSGPNPDTGGALDGNYQFVKTDSSGTVLAVSYGTNTVGSAPSGGNVWSNNGTWGNVQVGGSIKSESSGNIYYPPGCSPTTTTTSTTTTTTTTTTTPVTTTTTTTPATTTTTTLAKTTTSCSRSGNSGGPNPDTGGALVAEYQYVKTDSTGIVLTVSYGSNNVGQGVSGGNIWSNNGAWGNVQVGGSIKSENSGNIYYPPGCTPPITTSTVTTTTTSTTTTSTTIKPASSTTVQPIVNTAINSGSASTTTTIDTLFDDGSEQQEVIADISLQKSSNNYLIRITSNQEKTAVEIIARKKGAKNIIWKLVTDSNGAKRILTSRNLKGFTLALRIDGETIDTAKG